MSSVIGFSEQYGVGVEILDYVTRVLKDTARQHGYMQIQIPVVEKATSYSEEVIGKSPWPEWNQKGCFFFEIKNYLESYNEPPHSEEVLLIPEGTVSVTRWLGEQLTKSDYCFPIKMFYSLNCYRNELISTLTQTKCREFSQFGLEILGSNNPHSDIEVLCMVVHCLLNLGIHKDQIRIRLNDITIFNQLVHNSGLTDKTVELKELLDTLAEVKAGKGIERRDNTIKSINDILDEADISGNLRKQWNSIIEQQNYDLDSVKGILGDEYLLKIDNLKSIKEAFQKININIAPDLCVIRSHEYYTSISYEIDVITEKNSYIEIAGGGRYDRLVSHFVPTNHPIQQVPCTGFAFGVERVIKMLNQENLIKNNVSLSSNFYFGKRQEEITLKNKDLSEYIEAFKQTLKLDYPTNIKID